MANIADAFVVAINGDTPARMKKGQYLATILGLPGERLTWIGNVTVNDQEGASTFLVRGHATHTYTDVYVALSDYRLVLFKKWMVNWQCRSCWFKPDFEGEVFQYKEWLGRKRRYREMRLDIREKKGTFGPKLDVGYWGTSPEGKERWTTGFMRFTAVHGFDPDSGKPKKAYGEQVVQKIMDVYRNRQKPVSLTTLKHLRFEPQKLVDMSPKDLGKRGEEKKESMSPQPPKTTLNCPQCGKPVKTGVAFCGQCGHRLTKEKPRFPAVDKNQKKAHPAPPAEPNKEPPDTTSSPAEEKKKCPACGREVEADWKACPYCAASLPRPCPACGRDLQPEWVACPHCGKKK